MKALTIRQPWASLVALGLKRIETRSWPTTYRGPLAIHAGTSMAGFGRIGTRSAVGPWEVERVRESLLLRGPGVDWPYRLPVGTVVAVADLWDVQRAEDLDLPEDDPEWLVGDYRPGWHAWRLGSLRVMPRYHQQAGRLGLWNWTPPEGIKVVGVREAA